MAYNLPSVSRNEFEERCIDSGEDNIKPVLTSIAQKDMRNILDFTLKNNTLDFVINRDD